MVLSIQVPKVVKDWGLHPIIEHFTLEDIFERLQNGELEGASRVSLEIPDHAVFTCLIAPSTKGPFQTVFNSAKVGDIVEFGKYLKYLIHSPTESTDNASQSVCSSRNAFQVLLDSSRLTVVLPTHLLKIEPLLTRGDTNSSVIPLRPGLKRFLDHFCVDRRYFFSIKKCGSTTCSICRPPQLPVDIFDTLHHLPDPVPDSTGEHYKDFDDIYGSNTTEKHRPSLADSSRKPHGLPFQPNAQYAKNVNETIKCTECLKPRVLYSKNKLKFTDQITLQNLLVNVNYSCGSVLSDIQDETLSNSQREVVDKVFVRANLQCEDKIETPYYSSNSFSDVCIHCGDPDNIVQEETFSQHANSA